MIESESYKYPFRENIKIPFGDVKIYRELVHIHKKYITIYFSFARITI